MALIFILLWVINIGNCDGYLFLNTTQILNLNGFKNEAFEIVTEDGYILNLIHVLPKNSTHMNQSIILVPGLICSSDQFVIGGETSPAFYFSTKGYDVWMINTRGSIYSTTHVNPKLTYKEYWNFTYEQKATYDLFSSINFVKQQMKVNKVHLIGYSEGGTILITAMLLMPKYIEENVLSVTAWAGATKFDHNRSWALYLLTKFYLFEILDSLGFGETLSVTKGISLFTYILTEISPSFLTEFITSLISDGDSKGYTLSGLQGNII